MNICLDWRSHAIGPLQGCRICGGQTILRDENSRPCHKVCAEAELTTAKGKA